MFSQTFRFYDPGRREPPSAAPDFPLHRPEILDALRQGDMLLARAMAGAPARFKKGHELIRAGEACDTIYRLERGWAACTRLLCDGRRAITAIFLPGDLLGVQSLLLARHPGSVQCLTDLTVHSITCDRLQQLFETESSIALRVACRLGEEERRLHDHAIGLGRATAEERIATMLIDFHTRLSRAGLCEGNSYRFPLTQQETGDFLGLTLVHVNRVLMRLRHAGLVTVARGVVQIHDFAALRDLAQPLPKLFEPPVMDTPFSHQAAQAVSLA